LKKNEKDEKKKEKEKIAFLELLGDLILLIDGYRIFRLKNYETLEYRIKSQDVEKRLKIDWKKTYRILESMSELATSLPGVPRLKKIQIGTSFFGTAQFGVILLGFVFSRLGYISARLGPILFVFLIIASFFPLIGVFANYRIARKVEEYYFSHPKRFSFKIAQLKRNVQTLLDLLKDKLRNEDEKTRNKYGIIKMANTDYKGITILKSPGSIRKLYWIKIV